MVFCAIGAFSVVLMVWLPALLQGQPDATSTQTLVQSLPPLVGTAVLIVSLGVLYQWFALVAGRHGWVAFMLLVVLIVIVPVLVGQFYGDYLPRETGRQYVQQAELAHSFSPASQFARWINDPQDPRPLAPMVGVFVALLVASWVWMRRRIGAHVVVVARKLAAMGVPKTADS